jgi:DNA-binding transcriptional MerR regulator
VDRLWAIKTAQRLGFSLAEIAELLRTGRQQHVTGGLPERAAGKLAEIDRKIADLQAIRTALAQVIEARCDSLTNCTCPESVLETGRRSGRTR